jgi:hypothetical protein
LKKLCHSCFRPRQANHDLLHSLKRNESPTIINCTGDRWIVRTRFHRVSPVHFYEIFAGIWSQKIMTRMSESRFTWSSRMGMGKGMNTWFRFFATPDFFGFHFS